MKHAFAVAFFAILFGAFAPAQDATPTPKPKRKFFNLLPSSKKATPAPAPEPAATPTATPKPTPKATPRATPKPTPKPVAKSTPSATPAPEVKAEPAGEPKPEEKLLGKSVEVMAPAPPAPRAASPPLVIPKVTTPRPAAVAVGPAPAVTPTATPPATPVAKAATPAHATPPSTPVAKSSPAARATPAAALVAANAPPARVASPSVITSTIPPEPAQIVRAFFGLLGKSDIDGAYVGLMKGSKIGERPGEVRTLKAKTKEAIELFGAVHGYDLVDLKPVGERLLRATYLSLGHELPLRWRFYFYKAEEEWKLIDLRVDDKLTGIFDESPEDEPQPPNVRP